MEIRRSYDRLISTMGFPILVRCHLNIESGPCTVKTRLLGHLCCKIINEPSNLQRRAGCLLIAKFLQNRAKIQCSPNGNMPTVLVVLCFAVAWYRTSLPVVFMLCLWHWHNHTIVPVAATRLGKYRKISDTNCGEKMIQTKRKDNKSVCIVYRTYCIVYKSIEN